MMKGWIKKIFNPIREEKPAAGYNLWAGQYDNQPDNLILRLDEAIFNSFVQAASPGYKAVADMGCGTGRHWEKLLSFFPVRLAGFDVSKGMLSALLAKWPGAETYLLQDHRLPPSVYGQFDYLVSTLTLAHIPDMAAALAEWNKLLKPGADLIITDYHPTALQRDAKRTFSHKGKTIAVKSYVHSLEKLRQVGKQLGWTEMRFTERVIDEQVKEFYEKQHAGDLYRTYYGMPLIYGIHLKKAHAAT
ncbi:MAG: class I SAM-dependent methyltransferase [Chitinophagaceae bacterium]